MSFFETDREIPDLISITAGAQIIYRNQSHGAPSKDFLVHAQEQLRRQDCRVIVYENTNAESDLIRIQHKASVMAGHNTWNQVGQAIVQAVS